MRRVRAAIASSVVALAFVGCNAILDNQPGVLAGSDDSGTLPFSHAGTDERPMRRTPRRRRDAARRRRRHAHRGRWREAGRGRRLHVCPPGQQRCSGACVPGTDPQFGCGGPSCAPCVAAHATSACAREQVRDRRVRRRLRRLQRERRRRLRERFLETDHLRRVQCRVRTGRPQVRARGRDASSARRAAGRRRRSCAGPSA